MLQIPVAMSCLANRKKSLARRFRVKASSLAKLIA